MKVPTIDFGEIDDGGLITPHDNPMMAELKVASALVKRILIDMGSFANIITWECLKQLKYSRRDITPLVHLIFEFGGQAMNPTRMTYLPLRLGDKITSRNLKVDFLVGDVPTAHSVTNGRSNLHKVKAVIALYLL